MSKRLDRKVCVVTGTGGGQGREAARAFAAEGAAVVGADTKVEGAEETLRIVQEEGGSMVSLQPCDLSLEDDVKRLVDLTRSEFGGIDVLYNNASAPKFGWIEEMSYEDWRYTMVNEIDLVFLASKAFWPMLKEGGGGSIINTGSNAGSVVLRPLPGMAHSTAKAAVISMTRHMAMEGAEHGIRANSLSPALIDTPATHAMLQDDEWREQMMGHQMLRRVGTPADIVGCAIFLASDESSFVTGANFCVDAGSTAW